MNLLKGLNNKQLEAVEHFGSPLLVLAGAGSGKTKRILNKEFDIGKSIVIQGASLKAKVAEHTIDTAIDKRDNKKM